MIPFYVLSDPKHPNESREKLFLIKMKTISEVCTQIIFTRIFMDIDVDTLRQNIKTLNVYLTILERLDIVVDHLEFTPVDIAIFKAQIAALHAGLIAYVATLNTHLHQLLNPPPPVPAPLLPPPGPP